MPTLRYRPTSEDEVPDHTLERVVAACAALGYTTTRADAAAAWMWFSESMAVGWMNIAMYDDAAIVAIMQTYCREEP